jgi:hypothetical protein
LLIIAHFFCANCVANRRVSLSTLLVCLFVSQERCFICLRSNRQTDQETRERVCKWMDKRGSDRRERLERDCLK